MIEDRRASDGPFLLNRGDNANIFFFFFYKAQITSSVTFNNTIH